MSKCLKPTCNWTSNPGRHRAAARPCSRQQKMIRGLFPVFPLRGAACSLEPDVSIDYR